MDKHYFECDCSSDEHRIIFHYDKEDNALYGSFFLNTYNNIFQRTWVAIKYIFGYNSKYGHFNCWIMDRDDALRLRTLMDNVATHKFIEQNGPADTPPLIDINAIVEEVSIDNGQHIVTTRTLDE